MKWWMWWLAFPAVAVSATGGGNPYAYLKQGVGARGVGLGGACQSMVADGSSGYWNPAGYANCEGIQVYLTSDLGMASEPWQEEYLPQHTYVSASWQLRPKGGTIPECTVALSAHDFRLDGFRTTQVEGGSVVETGGEFGDEASELGLHVAVPISGSLLNVGLGILLHQQSLADRKASGSGMLLGAQVDLSEAFSHPSTPLLWILRDLRAGVCLRYASKERWDGDEQEYETPLRVDMSISCDVLGGDRDQLVTALGLAKQGVYRTQWRGGFEYRHDFDSRDGAADSPRLEFATLRSGFSGLYFGQQDGLDPLDQREYAGHWPIIGAGIQGRWNAQTLILEGTYESGGLSSRTLISLHWLLGRKES
jgi:hypothetical protein